MRRFTWAIAAAGAVATSLPALWTQPTALAATKDKGSIAFGKGCPVGAVPKPACKTNYWAKCVRYGPCHGHPWSRCLQWTCFGRDLNQQTKEPFKGPKPLPWSRRR